MTSAITDLIEQNEDFSASPTGGAPKIDILTKVRAPCASVSVR